MEVSDNEEKNIEFLFKVIEVGFELCGVISIPLFSFRLLVI